MKRIMAIAAVTLLLSVGAKAQTAKEIYSRYSDSEEVSAVYISSAMFKLMGKLPSMSVGGEDVNLSTLVKSLQSMYVIDCEDKETISHMKADVKNLTQKRKFELLMEAKDEGETVRIFTQGDENIVESFIMTADDGDDGYTFISLEGTMNRADLEKVIAKTAKTIQ